MLIVFIQSDDESDQFDQLVEVCIELSVELCVLFHKFTLFYIRLSSENINFCASSLSRLC